MSCFIVSPENIRAQAEFMACILNDGFTSRYRLGASEALVEALEGCKEGMKWSAHKIYRKLYIMNLQAYNARYHEDVKTFDRYKKTSPPGDLLQLHKYMRCYLYQCSEEPVYRTPLFKAVTETMQDLAGEIVSNMPGYEDKEWN